ncbi:MAG: hypothetical protein HWN69_00930 [Desulfobacterales bacterium]|nr:hypothetical protein [Desulfobacterales bacterium]
MNNEEVRGYFDQYWKHSSVLRNWFVAYGIGALALAIYNKGIFFSNPEDKKVFVSLIVWGISLQVLLTFLNKVIHWFVYYGKNLIEFQTTWRYKISYKISKCFIIDIIVDFCTMILYARALWIFTSNL